MSSPTRVLCYQPYNRWALHGHWEMTVLHALKLRGAEVEYVLCDGLYSDCDMFWEATERRPPNACTICQAAVTRLVAQMGMDFHWLGRYLTPDDTREAKRWAASLQDGELLTATYGDWTIGEWVESSVGSHLRTARVDAADPTVARVLRSYVYSGLVACLAIDRLLTEAAPDVMLLFNARHSSTRVAYELARARGIRVVVHERGMRNETLMLIENETCLSLEPVRRFWREWGDVPLSPEELETIVGHMHRREHGQGHPSMVHTLAPQPLDEVRAALRLSPDRPTWVLFTSSDDEVAAHPDWRSEFPTQREWIERTIEHARRNPQIDLVIRVHPNTGGRRSQGVNKVQLEEMRQLSESLPPNVRMIDADADISSYSLMDLASVGLVWGSTVALEMACKGKEVVLAAGNPVRGTPFIRTVEDPSAYETILSELLAVAPGTASPEIRRLALRFAYGYFYRLSIDFPLVRMPTARDSELAYDSLDALLPGRDPGLDRCARILLESEPVCPPPTEAERARSAEAEDAFLREAARRRVLAFAEELIADATLLQAWADAFDDSDDVTLLIHTLAAETDRLVEAVSRAGLDRADGPDLVAIQADAATLASVDAIFSRALPAGLPEGTPRYDDGSLAELAAVR